MDNRSKYDTDPLDPEFVRKVEEARGATQEQPVSEADTEAPTRRYDDSIPVSYPSVFVPPPYQPPANARSGAAPVFTGPPSSRPLPKLGVPEKLAMVVPYTPFYIGAVAALIELFLVPRSEIRTRFHAAQGLALHAAVFVIGIIFRLASFLVGSTMGGFSSFALWLIWSLFSLAALIFLIYSMAQVWQGKDYRIGPLAEVTQWINQRLEPTR